MNFYYHHRAFKPSDIEFLCLGRETKTDEVEDKTKEKKRKGGGGRRRKRKNGEGARNNHEIKYIGKYFR